MIIPARWDSTRFPGKVLAELDGTPLVVHACRLAARAAGVGAVLVATDDRRVADVVSAAGFEPRLTRPEHPSGTDRIAEALGATDAEVLIGLQADEPFLNPEDLESLATHLLDHGETPLATLSAPLGAAEYLDPNVVKLVTDEQGHALYFSRSPIPYTRPAATSQLPFPPAFADEPFAPLKHVGVYGWQRGALARFVHLPPAALERREGLEQLRALAAGWKIRVLPARGEPFGVDTPEDLTRAEQMIAERNRVR